MNRRKIQITSRKKIIKDFFSEYGRTIVIGVIIVMVLVFTTPFGNAITSSAGQFVGGLSGKSTAALNEMNYPTGTVLQIAGTKYIVVGNSAYGTELIAGQSIGNKQFQPNQYADGSYNEGYYDEEHVDYTRHDGQNSNVYENSYIDDYLENTYYNGLPEELKNAIVETPIKQTAYKFTGSNSKWKWFENADSPDGTRNWFYNEGTEQNKKWVRWDKVNLPDDETGIYPYSKMVKQDKGYNNQSYNEIKRHVYLPSVEEISNLVNLNSANKVCEFLKGTNNSVSHMWTRDTNSGSPRHAIGMGYYYHSLGYDFVTHTWSGVRPAFTADLSAISDITVVDTVNYK